MKTKQIPYSSNKKKQMARKLRKAYTEFDKLLQEGEKMGLEFIVDFTPLFGGLPSEKIIVRETIHY